MQIPISCFKDDVGAVRLMPFGWAKNWTSAGLNSGIRSVMIQSFNFLKMRAKLRPKSWFFEVPYIKYTVIGKNSEGIILVDMGNNKIICHPEVIMTSDEFSKAEKEWIEQNRRLRQMTIGTWN